MIDDKPATALCQKGGDVKPNANGVGTNVGDVMINANSVKLNNVKIRDGVKLYVNIVKPTGYGIMLNDRSVKKILTLNLKGDSVTLKINGVYVGTLNVSLFSKL